MSWSPPPEMPRRAWPLVRMLVAESRRAGQSDDAIPWLAAQIDAESSWDPDARSAYAEGLAQFTEQTAMDAPRWCEGASGDWRVPSWQIRCMIAYMRRIRERYASPARNDDDEWRMAQVGYNAGPGWLTREKRAAAHSDCYWSVRLACLRSDHACRESAAYVDRIGTLRELYQ